MCILAIPYEQCKLKRCLVPLGLPYLLDKTQATTMAAVS